MNSLYFKYYSRKFRRGMARWVWQGWPSPAPVRVKRKVLNRNAFANATWIETGTYLGETASYLAKKTNSKKVVSLEPSLELFKFAKKKWRRFQNLEILNESSETGFAKILKDSFGNVNFWLDGHNSGDITYLGDSISPIKLELSIIADNLAQFAAVSIFVDDIRLFNGKDDYPRLFDLIHWAESFGFDWKIEHDILIMKKDEPPQKLQ